MEIFGQELEDQELSSHRDEKSWSISGTPIEVTRTMLSDGMAVLDIRGITTNDAGYIIGELLPEVLIGFMSKNADYAKGPFHTADLLGEKGQFAELWRKVGKLYTSLWLGEKMNHESPEEILGDMIGHCFLALLFLNKKEDKEDE